MTIQMSGNLESKSYRAKSIKLSICMQNHKGINAIQSAIFSESYLFFFLIKALNSKAIDLSGEFEMSNPNYRADKDSEDKMFRYKVEEITEGWSGYITKKIDKLELNRLYFY